MEGTIGDGGAGLGRRHHPVLRIILVGVHAVSGQVAVGVVGIGRPADGGVLVQGVGRIG